MPGKNNKNKYLGIIAIILMIVFAATFIFSSFPPIGKSSKKSDSSKRNRVEIPFTKHGELSVITKDGEEIQKFNIEIADDDFHTQQGMMYRSKNDDNNAMLFIFPEEKQRWFYMKNTRIGLDIIYADSEGKIVSIVKYAKPYDESSLPSEYPAKYVLEINDGLADKLGIKEGDQINWTRTDN